MLHYRAPAYYLHGYIQVGIYLGFRIRTWARVWRYGNIVETFAVKINTETVNVVATDEIMIIALLQATRIEHSRAEFQKLRKTRIST